MFTKFLFTFLRLSWQVNVMRKKGIMLGARTKEGRQVYTYMFRDLFAEITYRNDNPEEPVEKFIIIPGFKKLHDYFEKEIKSARFIF
jgi:hypothetical protein